MANKVFGQPELFSMILSYLPVKDLFLARYISSGWRDSIERDAKTCRRLWMDGTDPVTVHRLKSFAPLRESLIPPNTACKEHVKSYELDDFREITLLQLNPLLFDQFESEHPVSGIPIKLRDLDKLLSDEHFSFDNLLFAQPSVPIDLQTFIKGTLPFAMTLPETMTMGKFRKRLRRDMTYEIQHAEASGRPTEDCGRKIDRIEVAMPYRPPGYSSLFMFTIDACSDCLGEERGAWRRTSRGI
ncbi:Hypothetical protein D9617_18g033280 [Elsinoe fawcettii]|nr:Hypothetical protein D9617_18g033280 [Elsinoe fawcettii]